jgi:hypothetical protein
MKSWKTTAAGISAAVAAIASAVSALVDNNPATNPDWAAVIAAVTAGIGLVFARDNKVTSEDAGAK